MATHLMWKQVFVLAALASAGLFAQEPGVHPITGRVYARPMSADGAQWLSRPERDQEEQPRRAIALLEIHKGETVADIGAGSGYLTAMLAKQAGPSGKVYAEDIQSRMLDLLRQNMTRQKLANVEPVLGAIDNPNLPSNTLDLALMCDVYHEFSEPQKMLHGIRAALKDGGRMVLIEYRGEDPDVPIRPEHKMTLAQVRAEVEPEGFHFVKSIESLPIQHIIIFTK